MERSFELRTVKLEFTRRKRIKRQQSGNEWSDNNQEVNGATTIFNPYVARTHGSSGLLIYNVIIVTIE